MDIKEQFNKAAIDVKSLDSRPDNATLLKLYALFKQGSSGDITGDRPGGFDFKGAAKYDAWMELKGKDSAEAMQEYIDLVNSLLG